MAKKIVDVERKLLLADSKKVKRIYDQLDIEKAEIMIEGLFAIGDNTCMKEAERLEELINDFYADQKDGFAEPDYDYDY